MFEEVVREKVLQEDISVEAFGLGSFISISTCPPDETFDPFYHEKGIAFLPNDLFKRYVVQEKFFKITDN